MAEKPSPFTPRRTPPPVRRLVIACVILLVGWLVFMQILPRTFLTPTIPQAAEPGITTPAATPTMNPPPPTPAPAQNETLARLQALEAKLDRLAQPAEPPARAEELRALEAQSQQQAQELAALKAEQTHALQTIALLDAFDRLKDRVLAGEPYADELARLRQIAPDTVTLQAPLEKLEAHALYGIPREEHLQESFAAAAQQALHPAPAEGAGFWRKTMANASQLMTIRRVGSQPGTSAEAILARAETALERGDVPAAIAEVSALQGETAQAMAGWLARAQAFVARDKALADLKTAILSR